MTGISFPPYDVSVLVTSQLSEAVERLYSVFERYRLRPNTDACPCHHTTQEEQQLHVPLLRKLSQSDLRTYAMDALYIWGNEEDFKHFLPRIFELLAESRDFEFVDPQMVFRKLVYQSHWRSWLQPESDAILDYFQVLWDASINSDPEDLGFAGAYGWIGAIAQAEHDLSPYLSRWITSSSANSHRNLALTVVRFPFTRAEGGYWEDRREQWQQLGKWLRLPEVKNKLVQAVETWSDEPFGNELFDAAALL